MTRISYTILLMLLCYNVTHGQQKIEHVIIVTTDGFRWQEVFTGMDAALAMDKRFDQNDSAGIYHKYWAATAAERRKLLLPFLWITVATKGQLYGNRDKGCKVNNANPYWFSYPGYNEIMTGYVDSQINSNAYPANPNTNLLEYLNKQQALKGRVAAFGAWNAFDRILNEQRSGIPVVCGMDNCGDKQPDAEQQLINAMRKDAYTPFGEEALDVFTHYAAMDHLKKNAPVVLYISYGETDEWAHEGHYKDYLDAAHNVDKWLNDIWQAVQADKRFRDKTLLFVTVDHGRGKGNEWTSHNKKIAGSDEIWFAIMGPGVAAKGEIAQDMQVYQQQFAQTIAHLMGYHFTCEHPVAEPVAIPGR